MKYLLIVSLLFAVGCTKKQAGPTYEQLKELAFESCQYGAIKTQVTLLEEGVLLPDINTDVYLGKGPAMAICQEMVDKFIKQETVPNR